MTDNSWDGILEDGERILWQGQPSEKLSAKPGQIFESFFGLFFVGFSVIWMRVAYSIGAGPFWMFGLIFFFTGLYLVFGKYFWQSYERGHTWYTLSTRKAYIATDTPLGGRKLKSYPITDETEFEFDPGRRASVYFARDTYRVNGRTRWSKIGFENLDNGREVLDLLLKVQKGQA